MKKIKVDFVEILDMETFNKLRQGIALYKKEDVLYIRIEDLDTGVETPIHNVSKKTYKRLKKVYKELDTLIKKG